MEEQNALIQKAQQETKQTLTKTEKDLAQAHQSRARRKERIDLAQAKINELETQLLQLAKQKLASKKEAQALVNQLETQ